MRYHLWRPVSWLTWILTHWPLRDVVALNFKSVISECMLRIKLMSTSCKNIWWMPQETFDNKSKLVQVMAWCHQATSHYLNQCWPRSMSPSGVTRPQWVNMNLLQISAGIPWNWCHQATSHYLNECWPRSMSPSGVTRPQWVNMNLLQISAGIPWNMATIYLALFYRGSTKQSLIMSHILSYIGLANIWSESIL